MSEPFPTNHPVIVPPPGSSQLSDDAANDNPTARSLLQNDETISLLDILAVLLRHKRLILIMSALVAALLLGYAALTLRLPVASPFNLLPNVYTPTADVLLSPTKSNSSSLTSLLSQSDLGSLAGLLGGRGTAGNTNADLVTKLLKGATLRDQIAGEMDFVGHYHIVKNPRSSSRAVFDRALKTQYDAASSVLTLSFTDTDKEFATNVLNALIVALEARFNSLTAERLDETRALLAQQLAGAESDLKAAETALVDFSKAHGIVDINSQRSSYVDTNAAFRQQLAQAEVSLAELMTYRSADDPQVKQLQSQIAVLRQFIGESTTGYQKFSPLSIPENQIPGVAAEYLNLQYDLQLRQGAYLSTRQNWESVVLQQKGSVPEFQVLERAQVPELKSGPSRSKIVVIGTIAGIFLAILIAFVLEYFRRASGDPVESWKLLQIRQLIRPRKNWAVSPRSHRPRSD